MQDVLLEYTSTDGALSLENATLRDLERLPALQREKLYALFRERRQADRNNPEYLQHVWETDHRWKGIERRHTAEDIIRLRGNISAEYARSSNGARKFWENCVSDPEPQRALGCYTGHQAVQTVTAGCPVVYVGGWNVAADGNEDTLTDQSVYEPKKVPEHVYKMNNALEKAQKNHWFEGTKSGKDWMAPLVADMEAGYGGELNVDMVTKWNIEAGAAAIHLEDQISSKKKCGHLDGKLLRSTEEGIVMLQQVRQRADVMDVPLVIIARTDAVSAGWIMTDVDERDRPFITRERSPEGYYRYRGGLKAAVARGLAFCPHADMVWFESKSPDLEEARIFAEAIHAEHPGKLLGYNCSGNFNWKAHFMSKALSRYGMPLNVKEIAGMGYEEVEHLVGEQIPNIPYPYKQIEHEVDEEMAAFQRELGKIGYKFQFVTTAGYWTNNVSSFELAQAYKKRGMAGFSQLQERGFALRKHGFDAATPQTFVGVKRADFKVQCANGGQSSTLAFKGSTEAEQFNQKTS